MVVLIFRNYRHGWFDSFYSKWCTVFIVFLLFFFQIVFLNDRKILIFSSQFIHLNLINHVKRFLNKRIDMLLILGDAVQLFGRGKVRLDWGDRDDQRTSGSDGADGNSLSGCHSAEHLRRTSGLRSTRFEGTAAESYQEQERPHSEVSSHHITQSPSPGCYTA